MTTTLIDIIPAPADRAGRAPSMTRHLIGAGVPDRDRVMTIPLVDALAVEIMYRVQEGFEARAVPLFTENYKLEKSATDKVDARGLFIPPADLTGFENCAGRSAGCTLLCLNGSGHASRDSAKRGRMWRGKFLAGHPLHFFRVMAAEVQGYRRLAARKAKQGWRISLRPNGTADLPFERIAPWIIEMMTAPAVVDAKGRTIEVPVVVYDYTKLPGRDAAVKRAGLAYDLSYSVSERTTDDQIDSAVRPVVVVNVKRGAPLPTMWRGRRVIDGDKSDFRPADPADGSVVIMLRYKPVPGFSLVDAVATGFVRDIFSDPSAVWSAAA